MPQTNPTHLGKRIVVVGATGSGKTTLAACLAALAGAKLIELDALHWEPNWTKAPPPVFTQRIEGAINCDAWVADGNYAAVRHLLWSRADMLVWLDYSLPRVLWQLTGRTLRRTLRREKLWNGNQESFRTNFLSKDSIFLWALRSQRTHRQQYPALCAHPEYAHLAIVRLNSPRQTRRWLAAASQASTKLTPESV